MRPDGRLLALLLATLMALAPAACGHPDPPPPPQAVAPTLQNDPTHPGQTQGWVRTELYFGLGLADHPERGITETAWREFLDKEVTPRFPDGLSVEDAYGQWLSKGEADPSRLRSKVLIILYPGTDEDKAKIEAIRAAWKQMTGHQSVLRVTQPADVSF